MNSGIVTFGESKRVHSDAMKERTSALGGESVTEFIEYKNCQMYWSISNQYPDSVTRLHVQTDGRQNSAFIKNLDQDSKGLLFLGCLPPPFDYMTLTVITRFFASAIGKIYISGTLKDYVALGTVAL